MRTPPISLYVWNMNLDNDDFFFSSPVSFSDPKLYILGTNIKAAPPREQLDRTGNLAGESGHSTDNS